MRRGIKMEFYSTGVNLRLIDYVNGFSVLFAYKK